MLKYSIITIMVAGSTWGQQYSQWLQCFAGCMLWESAAFVSNQAERQQSNCIISGDLEWPCTASDKNSGRNEPSGFVYVHKSCNDWAKLKVH